MKKNKAVAATLAAAVAATSLLAGTYAWKSVSQRAKNEIQETKNPGARLHDDFKFTADGNKDVYVENFTTTNESGVPIYARIRLDEYLEIGTKAGEAASADKKVDIIKNEGTTPTFENEKSWTTYKWEREKLMEADNPAPLKDNETSVFRKYFLWNQDGSGNYDNDNQIYYMPTFNKDKDSLAADINGTLQGKDGLKTNPYDDNVVYSEGDEVTNIAVYDIDENGDDNTTDSDLEAIIDALTTQTEKPLALGDKVTERKWDAGKATGTMVEAKSKTYGIKIVKDSNDTNIEYIDVALDPNEPTTYNVRLKQETHTAAQTRAQGKIISMAKWKQEGSKPGDYWVYDTDGWVYWANPLKPGESTSLLLDKVEIRNETSIEEQYYYAINVVAQFCTKSESGTWTDFEVDQTITDDAKRLLNNASGVAYSKYTVAVAKAENTDETAEVKQEESVRLRAVVLDDDKTVTPNITWTVKREDGQAIDDRTGFTDVPGVTQDVILKVGVGEALGKLIVTATHRDENGCYGIGEFEITVKEGTVSTDLRSKVKEAAQNVTTGEYNVAENVTVTIDEQKWYVIATDNDSAPTKALLYAASSLDYDGTGTYQWVATFGEDSIWKNSNIRKYLNDDVTYAGESFADQYPHAFVLAEETRIYTRTSVDSVSGSGMEDFTPTDDRVFLLSEADFFASFRGTDFENSGAQVYDYTVRKNEDGVEKGVKLWNGVTNEERKDPNGQWTWLRSPIRENNIVARVGKSGGLFTAEHTVADGALRPAFWVDITSVEPNE